MRARLVVSDDGSGFDKAAALSLKVNFEMLDAPLKKVVVYLDPGEFKSTWLGNKSIIARAWPWRTAAN